jgi:hypothetical protein
MGPNGDEPSEGCVSPLRFEKDAYSNQTFEVHHLSLSGKPQKNGILKPGNIKNKRRVQQLNLPFT